MNEFDRSIDPVSKSNVDAAASSSSSAAAAGSTRRPSLSSLEHGHRHHDVAHPGRRASETAVSVGVTVGAALSTRPVSRSDVTRAATIGPITSNARGPRMMATKAHHLARVTVAHAPGARPVAGSSPRVSHALPGRIQRLRDHRRRALKVATLENTRDACT